MVITSYENLQKWFVATKGTKPAPYWNLYSLKYGRGDQVVHRNVDVSDLDESARKLEEAVRMLTPGDEPARFKLSVYPEGSPNNPTASVEVQIRNAGAAQVAGIGSLPMAGFVSLNELEQRLENERLKWKLELMEDQMNAPGEMWERIVERVSGIPGIDKIFQTLAIGLVSKVNPGALPAIQAAMNGVPSANEGEHDGDEAAGDPNQVFAENIQISAATLGVDPLTLSAKLKKLIQENPELAKQMMSQ